jgi:TPR repeat protein
MSKIVIEKSQKTDEILAANKPESKQLTKEEASALYEAIVRDKKLDKLTNLLEAAENGDVWGTSFYSRILVDKSHAKLAFKYLTQAAKAGNSNAMHAV